MIEDDSDQALLTREVLEEEMRDAEVTIVATGGAALEQDLSAFNAIILDYNLPDMTGLDVLRALSERQHGPVIMITGEEVLEIAVQSLKEGAEEFIIKSVDLHQLLPHIVERTISTFYQRKRIEEMEIREREKKVQIDTLMRILMTLAHHLNNAVMPIIFSAELCQRGGHSREKAESLVDTCLHETQRINTIIERFERYIESGDFQYMDYLDLKDAMFDVRRPAEQD